MKGELRQVKKRTLGAFVVGALVAAAFWGGRPKALGDDSWDEARPGARKTLTIAGVEFAFRRVPAGTFFMGSPATEKDRFCWETQRKVTLTKGFWLLETETTRAMWRGVMGDKSIALSGTLEEKEGRNADNLPIEGVGWFECRQYLDKLNANAPLPPGWKFAFPTEAQWEYACRAGTTGAFGDSDNPDELNETTWFEANGGMRLHEVKTKRPNAWGLYDMRGNVREWCFDRFADYPKGDAVDPTGPDDGYPFVNRGGCWSDYAKSCRAAYRVSYGPTDHEGSVGLRPALVRIE